MGGSNKHYDLERNFARRLADAINVERSTDYTPVEVCDEQFPDFHLRSASGLPKLDVEVVTVPVSDFAARRDTGIQQRLRQKLQERFAGQPGLVIEVNLRQKGLSRHLDDKPFADLVGIVETLIADRDPERGIAKTSVLWQEHQELSESVSHVWIHTLPGRNAIPYVWFPLCFWAPKDCGWILDGIEHKLCYPPAVLQQTILVVGDMASFGERDVVEKSKASGEFSRFPFKEVWLASTFPPIPGIMRLK